jgi:quercetin dioxygenase-like cupin family protein
MSFFSLIKRKPQELDIEKRIYRENIVQLEELIRSVEGSVIGDSDVCPLTHTFTDGIYVRQIFMPKGMLIVSKIHKYEHPYFVLSGRVSVLTEDGVQDIVAPYSGITKPGTKRLLYIHEDTVWTTIHPTKLKDLKKIEDKIIARSYDDLPKSLVEKVLLMLKK